MTRPLLVFWETLPKFNGLICCAYDRLSLLVPRCKRAFDRRYVVERRGVSRQAADSETVPAYLSVYLGYADLVLGIDAAGSGRLVLHVPDTHKHTLTYTHTHLAVGFRIQISEWAKRADRCINLPGVGTFDPDQTAAYSVKQATLWCGVCTPTKPHGHLGRSPASLHVRHASKASARMGHDNRDRYLSVLFGDHGGLRPEG